jgi:hypothetical protein
VNAGHEINSTPAAGFPSARNTVSLIVVSEGVCPNAIKTISMDPGQK